MSGVRLLPYGDAAVLVEVADLDAALALHADLRAHPPVGLVDAVPAERTVLVRLDPSATTVAALRDDLVARRPPVHSAVDGPLVTVPVVYDGADLADVAAGVGWTVDHLVAAHQERTWRVAFAGFAPGFGYLVPDGAWPEVPRRADPRTSRAGRCGGPRGPLRRRLPPAQPGWLAAGGPHRPRGLGRRPRAAGAARARHAGAVRGRAVTAGLEVVDAGPLTTVQDLGRPGLASLGVSPSGAADRASAQRANALVGNPASAAVLEVTLGGLRMLAHVDTQVAVAGAPVTVTVDGAEVGSAVVRLTAGSTLRLGRPALGVRTYLAVRGGVDVPAVLGSRSTDLLSGLGPSRLRPGDVIPVG